MPVRDLRTIHCILVPGPIKASIFGSQPTFFLVYISSNVICTSFSFSDSLGTTAINKNKLESTNVHIFLNENSLKNALLCKM